MTSPETNRTTMCSYDPFSSEFAALLTENHQEEASKTANHSTTTTTVSNVASSSLQPASTTHDQNQTLSSRRISKPDNPQNVQAPNTMNPQSISEAIILSSIMARKETEVITAHKNLVISCLKENINFFNSEQLTSITGRFAALGCKDRDLTNSLIQAIKEKLKNDGFTAEQLDELYSAVFLLDCRDYDFIFSLTSASARLKV